MASLVQEVSEENLMRSTRTIAQWVRLSGTPEERQAFDWIEGEMKGYGLRTERYSFASLVSWPETASLQVGGEDVPCATHAFATSTPPEGIEAELVYCGRGTPAELEQARGKIALIDGIVAPNRNLLAEAAGVVASIWIAGEQLHERILSPVWGTPTPETAHLLPKTPSLSVKGDVGARLKASLPATARIQTKVYRGWNQLPCLTAQLDAPNGDGTFVMFSGHVDSWYYGAMDNGTANATMLEVARIMAGHRGELRRGLRVCFWSGHSHGRYSGSTWYADNFWQDLHDHCAAHVNVDSVGGKGATLLSEGNSMAEIRGYADAILAEQTGQHLEYRRYGRSGDQSFWGHGIPSLFMSLSEQPAENADPVLAALHHQISGGQGGSGGLGWWWHTPEDLPDKIDPAYLRRDAAVYVLAVHGLLTAERLPFDYEPVAAELEAAMQSIAANFDLAAAFAALAGFREALKGLPTLPPAAYNRALVGVGRALIPVNYARSGLFDHDLAVPTAVLPGLQAAKDLTGLKGDMKEFTRTRLVRERNRLVHALREATAAVTGAGGA
ncbi:MAG TPA: M28 family peptidase [Bacillota bacterium]|nr:M28 family peptidase [Bacillota bacterium]